MSFKISPNVAGRIVQILQEALYTGTDVSDLLLQMELEECSDELKTLVMTQAYVDLIEKQHKQWLAMMESRQNVSNVDTKILVDD